MNKGLLILGTIALVALASKKGTAATVVEDQPGQIDTGNTVPGNGGFVPGNNNTSTDNDLVPGYSPGTVENTGLEPVIFPDVQTIYEPPPPDPDPDPMYVQDPLPPIKPGKDLTIQGRRYLGFVN